MPLARNPETQQEYWGTIETLGGFIFRNSHDLADDRIQDPKGELDTTIIQATKLQSRLVDEVCSKFGVIHPRDIPQVEHRQELPAAPEGKTYYWDWYRAQKREFMKTEWEKMICSACPLSEGYEGFVISGVTIPCKPFPGSLRRLESPEKCAMVSRVWGLWTEDRLFQEILIAGGSVSLREFVLKQEQLRPITK